jgi:acyl carrier protein
MILENKQSDTTEEAILACVRRQLGEVIGDPEMLSTEITMQTKFGSDLELESIEFVALASHLSTEFGDRVNFVYFLSTREVDEIVSLTIGDVVRYVETCLRTDKTFQGALTNGLHTD